MLLRQKVISLKSHSVTGMVTRPSFRCWASYNAELGQDVLGIWSYPGQTHHNASVNNFHFSTAASDAARRQNASEDMAVLTMPTVSVMSHCVQHLLTYSSSTEFSTENYCGQVQVHIWGSNTTQANEIHCLQVSKSNTNTLLFFIQIRLKYIAIFEILFKYE